MPKIAEVKEGLFEGGDFAFLNEHWIAVGMAYLHLDMCFNLVDAHIAVAYVDGLPEAFRKELRAHDIEFVPVEEESIFLHGCNLQALGNHRVLSLKQNARVNEELAKRGMEVIELDITEILKAGGGSYCMTFPLEREK